jgi:hypothetical protein
MFRAAMRSWSILAATLLGASSAWAADTPTYNKDVASIINAKCVSCHRPNQVAPMALLSYREVRPWARAIKAKVTAREMPPWQADPRYGKFKNDPSLSAAELAKVTAWVDAGAPEGGGAPPEPPRFSAGGWTHPSGRDPDLVYEFPVELQLPASGEMPNFNAYTPLPFNDARLIEATEILPGNFKATHHLTASPTNLPPGMKLGRGAVWPGGPVLDNMLVPDDSPVDASKPVTEFDAAARAGAGASIKSYIPGTRVDPAPPGEAREMRGDLFKYVVWNLHYQATGEPERARPKIGFWFAPKQETKVISQGLTLREYTSENRVLIAPPGLRGRFADGIQPGQPGRRRPTAQVQDLNPLLDPIPPNKANWTVTGIGAFQNDATIQSVFIHMHLRGRDCTIVATYPDGREEIVMRVPNYRFDWQYEYEFAEPLNVPAGTTLKAITRYDNSPANRFNPAPHKQVYWSEQSWDDMYLVTVRYIPNAPAAPPSTPRVAGN